MAQCVAYMCFNRKADKVPGVTFHKFPKDEILRKLWECAIGREKFKATDHSLLCSLHFNRSDFDESSPFVRKLKTGTIPTVFHPDTTHTPEPMENMKTKKRKMEHQLVIKVQDQDAHQIGEAELHAQQAQAQAKENELVELRAKCSKLSRKMSEKTRKIKVIQEQKRRLELKVSRLRLIIDHLTNRAKLVELTETIP